MWNHYDMYLYWKLHWVKEACMRVQWVSAYFFCCCVDLTKHCVLHSERTRGHQWGPSCPWKQSISASCAGMVWNRKWILQLFVKAVCLVDAVSALSYCWLCSCRELWSSFFCCVVCPCKCQCLGEGERQDNCEPCSKQQGMHFVHIIFLLLHHWYARCCVIELINHEVAHFAELHDLA